MAKEVLNGLWMRNMKKNVRRKLKNKRTRDGRTGELFFENQTMDGFNNLPMNYLDGEMLVESYTRK